MTTGATAQHLGVKSRGKRDPTKGKSIPLGKGGGKAGKLRTQGSPERDTGIINTSH